MAYDVLAPEAARLWPFQPDWSRGYTRIRAFSTDISSSRNRTEQRRSLRAVPRLSAEYTTVVSDAERRRAESHLRAAQDQPVAVPDWARFARLTGSTALGGSTLTISPMPAWAVAGQLLVLCGSAGLEQVIVASVAGSTITLEEPVGAAWASGSVLRPTFFGLLDSEVGASRPNKAAASMRVVVSSYPKNEPPSAVGTAWATFNSYEIFTLQPDFSGSPSTDFIWPVEQVDYGRGRTAQFRPIERTSQVVDAEFRGLDVDGAEEVEQFFDRMKGRRGAFYMPTGQKDFGVLSFTDASFLAEGPELADDFGGADFDDTWAIAVCLTNGTHIYRLVTGIGADGDDSRISVNANWGTTLTTSNVARISWMPLWRFASDEMATVFATPSKANIRLPFQTVPA